jgi:DNA-binding IclR family transcriptional regulator
MNNSDYDANIEGGETRRQGGLVDVSPREDRTSRVQSVDRAMALLRAVATAAPEDSTVARLAETCALNRATAWRILRTLEAHDAVACHPETGRWSVGVGVLDIAAAGGADTIVSLARPRLQRLSEETGETAALALWRQGALTYVDEVVPSAIVAATWLGQAVPLHATSTGKVLLAFGVAPVPSRLERFTATTISSAAQLRAELEEVRSRRFADCRGEYETSAWGVSAPVPDRSGRPVAVLSVWGPASRVTEDLLGTWGPLVRDTAATLLDG